MEYRTEVIVLFAIIIAILICAIVIKKNGRMEMKMKNAENMAPVGFGTYKNNYKYGGCDVGSFKRTDCMVGNCPIGSPISNDEFCYIQCAQGVGKEDQMECYKHCIDLMEGGCR